VRSLVTGRALHKAVLEVAVHRARIVELASARQILLKPNGSVAWVQEDGYGGHNLTEPPAYGIYAIDTHGFHALASALSAPPQAVRLRGSRVTWLQGGARLSATID
jgi:hypothetical protein